LHPAPVHGGPGGDYRRDIDGLRAVAILSVLFAHADIPGFSGGFVGVDVFFVISGFLITRLVLARIEAGTFSLVDFLERRASRLTPALIAVLLASAAFGYAVLTPSELVLLGQDITATALFAMNFQGWMSSGYFGPEAATRILLHAWSLAVEEQFYLILQH
jgi:peptidoglycan/LPS O-acetylase OafA/YrhL